MPELPDLTIYLDALQSRVMGQKLEGIRIRNPFVLRSVMPPVEDVAGREVVALRRIGKRIVFELEEKRFVVVHLMIAGRFQWGEPGAKLTAKPVLAGFDFQNGTLILTEQGAKRRASIHLVEGEKNLEEFDAGGIDVLSASAAEFREALTRENHTLKRSLTDPRLFSGIGNAYSDEILHRAQLSPMKLTSKMNAEEIERLHRSTRDVLAEWIERLRGETGSGFPSKVTAFRKEMATHGKFGKPCPVCGDPVQRIVYAENEANYCATCQTGGKLLADRALSKLLHEDWPRSLEEMEERKKKLSG